MHESRDTKDSESWRSQHDHDSHREAPGNATHNDT